MKSIVLIILLVSYVSLASATNKVIYGDDNRLDYYEVTNPLIKKIAISTAAMISSSSLKTEGEIVHINAGTLSGYGGLS